MVQIKKKKLDIKKDKFQKINYKKFIEENFMVLDRESQILVPFKFNAVQEKYYRMIKEKYDGKLEGVRDIILKARQQGMSSFILALFAVDFLFRPYSVSVCISHRKDSADFLFKKVKFYLDCYIDKLAEKTGKDTNALKKEFFKSNNKNLLENNLNGASFYILTAGAKVGGRGNSARNVLFCVGEDTKIILPSGQTKAIKNINVGDEVISRFGEKTIVTNKWNSGVKPMKKIKLWLSNESIEVSPDHKVMTIDGWKQAKNLTTRDYVEWSYTKTSEIVKQISIPRIKNYTHLKNKNYLRYKKKNNNFYIKIQSIQDAPNKQTYEIEVKNQSHAYLTVGGVIANSEAAFYQDTELVTAQEMIMATAQMVPQGHGMIFMESTANGEGNYYHKTWQLASRNESAYRPIFFGWQEFYSEEWVKEKRKSFTNDKMFMQEYPSNPEEAFITSGTPFFDVHAIKEMMKEIIDPDKVGRFSTGGYFEESDFEEDAMAKLYRDIKQDEQFVVFADPADGQDYCAAVAFSKKHYDIPIVFNAKMESSQFGYDLYYMGTWIYNKTGIWPKLAVERNTGQATIYVLKQLNYPDLFRMVDFTARESGVYEKGNIGWTTTGYVSAGELKGTRRKMLDDLAMAIRQRKIKIYDKDIFKQLKAFKIIKGRAQASRNHHDDLTIAVAGAYQIQELTPDYNFGWNEDKATREARRKKWRFQ